MHYILLNLGKSIIVAIGLHAIFNNWIIAILASIIVEGFLSTKVWFLSGIWYPIFEYFYLGNVTQYGWWVLGLSAVLIITSVLESIFMEKRF